MKSFHILTPIIVILIQFLTLQHTFAQDTTIPFSIEPIPSNEQKKGAEGYYHIEISEGKKITLQVKVQNESRNPLTVELKPLDALAAPLQTSGIVYSEQKELESARILNPESALSNLIKLPSEVILGAGESKLIAFTIDLSNYKEGSWIGGIRASLPVEEQPQTSQSQGETTIIVNNRITYTLPIQIDLQSQPKADFSFGNVGFLFQADHAEFYVEMQNASQKIIRNVTGNYRIENQNGDEIVSGKWDEFGIAPNAWFHYPIEWTIDPLPSGEYPVYLEAIVEGKTITANPMLIINENVQEQLEEKTQRKVPDTPSQIPIWIWIVIASSVAIIFLLLGLLLGKRNKN